VRARDFSGLLQAGGNIYFLIKLGVVTGNGLYRIGATMRGESYEQFLATRNDAGAT
jgi:protocatechuate 4,5-dioxygenase alpha chain